MCDFPIKLVIKEGVGEKQGVWKRNSHFSRDTGGVDKKQLFFQGQCVFLCKTWA